MNSSETSLQSQNFLQGTDSLIQVNPPEEMQGTIRSIYDLAPRKPRHSTPNSLHSSATNARSSRRFTADRLTRHQRPDESTFPYTTYDEKSLVIYSRLIQSSSTSSTTMGSTSGRQMQRRSFVKERTRLFNGTDRARRSRTGEVF